MSEPNHDSQIILPSRRNVLATAAFGAAGLMLGNQSAQGFFFRQSPPLDLTSLPQTWVRREGEKRIQSYGRYLQKLRLKHVDPLLVIKAHAKKKGSLWNALPPRSMWKSMAGTLKTADRIASELGQPVREVTSAYRSPGYNRRCPGAKSRSWHMQNYALDLKFGVSPWKVAQAARYVRSKGHFKGGIGRYSSFTHIDTRGHNVDW